MAVAIPGFEVPVRDAVVMVWRGRSGGRTRFVVDWSRMSDGMLQTHRKMNVTTGGLSASKLEMSVHAGQKSESSRQCVEKGVSSVPSSLSPETSSFTAARGKKKSQQSRWKQNHAREGKRFWPTASLVHSGVAHWDGMPLAGCTLTGERLSPLQTAIVNVVLSPPHLH